jgi:hypothetical protein
MPSVCSLTKQKAVQLFQTKIYRAMHKKANLHAGQVANRPALNRICNTATFTFPCSTQASHHRGSSSWHQRVVCLSLVPSTLDYCKSIIGQHATTGSTIKLMLETWNKGRRQHLATSKHPRPHEEKAKSEIGDGLDTRRSASPPKAADWVRIRQRSGKTVTSGQ